MLQAPSLINPFWDVLLPQSSQVWCMVHPYLDSVGTEFRDQGRQQRRTRSIWGLPRSSQCIRQDTKLQVRFYSQSLLQRRNLARGMSGRPG